MPRRVASILLSASLLLSSADPRAWAGNSPIRPSGSAQPGAPGALPQTPATTLSAPTLASPDSLTTPIAMPLPAPDAALALPEQAVLPAAAEAVVPAAAAQEASPLVERGLDRLEQLGQGELAPALDADSEPGQVSGALASFFDLGSARTDAAHADAAFLPDLFSPRTGGLQPPAPGGPAARHAPPAPSSPARRLVDAAMDLYRAVLARVRSWFAWPQRTIHRSAPGAQEAAYRKLQANLERLGFAPGPDGLSYAVRKVPGALGPDRPTVALLAPASLHKLAIAREGGRQSPGDMHLALDPSWLIVETGADGRGRLLLTRGLYFDEGGRPVLAEYAVPRPVRYFRNFYTPSANERDDGLPLEKDLDVPMSTSHVLESVVNDKLLTRLFLAAQGIAVPATLAFVMAAHPLSGRAASAPAPSVSLADMPSPEDPARRAAVRASVERFLAANRGRLSPLVWVKPSGPMWHSARGVRPFPVSDLDAIVDHVLALSADPDMTMDGAVLIDGAVTPPPLYARVREGGGEGILVYDRIAVRMMEEAEKASAAPAEKKDWNLRVLVARAPWGEGVTSGYLVRAGAWGEPTNAVPGSMAVESDPAKWDPADVAKAAVVLRAEDVLAALKRQHPELRLDAAAERAFLRDLDALGPRAMAAVSQLEARRPRRDGEPYQAQTDLVGLDVIVEHQDGRLVPHVIEVNDDDSGSQPMFDWLHPDRAGQHSRVWVATMLARARRDALKGKRIVVVGAGYAGKRFIFERAKALGVKVTLIDVPGSWAADIVDEYIPLDTTDHSANARTRRRFSVEKALKKLARRTGKRGPIHGVTSFWEDDVPFAAELAEALKLPFPSPAAAETARSKLRTRQAMRDAGMPEAVRYGIVRDGATLEAAIAAVGFPAVLKPVGGASSFGVTTVRSPDEARTAYALLRRQLAEEAKTDPIFNHSHDFVLEEYLDGDEVDVDIVVQGGKVVFSSVTDNWPTSGPHHLPTGSSLPSRLTREKASALEDLAARTAAVVGLGDGSFHIEAKYTSRGPRIVEVNARVGGAYVPHWVLDVWGVDLIEQAFLTATGIPAAPYKPAKPRTWLNGRFIMADRSGRVSAIEVGPLPEGVTVTRHKKEGDAVLVPPEGYNARVAMVTASDEDAAASLRRLSAADGRVRVTVEP